jgi:hypothetical protein
MVSILPSARTPWDVIGADVGQALQGILPGAVEKGYNRGMLQQGIGNIAQTSQNPNSSNLDIMLAAMQAGAGIPGSERYLGQIIPELIKQAEARRSSNVPLAGDVQQPQQRQREEHEGMQPRQQLPSYLNQPEQTSQFFPTNNGPQGGPGHAFQPATQRKVEPLKTPAEERQAAGDLYNADRAAGGTMTKKDALDQIRAEEEYKKIYNQSIEDERKAHVASQTNYGAIGEKHLKDVYPEATPEDLAIFKKKGEQAALSGDSEAEIDRKLANDAKNFKNAIVNVKKEMSAPRALNKITRGFEGTYKDLEKASADLRSHLKPMLDLGLYDKARNLLKDLDYGPEEREAIINPLSEHEKVVLNKVPQAVKTREEPHGAPITLSPTYKYAPGQLQNIKEGLTDLKKADPNFSLVLARKVFEDKGYDWRMFKDALNELEREGFTLEDDQNNQKTYLDTPPLNDLQKILHGLNLIGR